MFNAIKRIFLQYLYLIEATVVSLASWFLILCLCDESTRSDTETMVIMTVMVAIILIGVGIFLDRLLRELQDMPIYMMAINVVIAPVRVFTQFASLVMLHVALFKHDEDFGKRGVYNSSFSEQILYLLFTSCTLSTNGGSSSSTRRSARTNKKSTQTTQPTPVVAAGVKTAIERQQQQRGNQCFPNFYLHPVVGNLDKEFYNYRHFTQRSLGETQYAVIKKLLINGVNYTTQFNDRGTPFFGNIYTTFATLLKPGHYNVEITFQIRVLPPSEVSHVTKPHTLTRTKTIAVDIDENYATVLCLISGLSYSCTAIKDSTGWITGVKNECWTVDTDLNECNFKSIHKLGSLARMDETHTQINWAGAQELDISNELKQLYDAK